MFRKVTIITDTGLEKKFREGFPLGTAYALAYYRAVIAVGQVIGRADGFPFAKNFPHKNMAWLNEPLHDACKALSAALTDCTRVEAVVKLDTLGVHTEVDISMYRGKVRYGFVCVGIATFEQGGKDDLEYAVTSRWNFVRG